MSSLKLGVIADDFTGATDIASFMVEAGWRVVQLIGDNDIPLTLPKNKDLDAVVISLKSRSNNVTDAIKSSIEAAKWLKAQGAKQLFFKYCSTFDSTAKGNIGPVAEALLNYLESDCTIFCPGLPINGRTVLHGHLFVNGVLLNESGMQNHPITPMKDPNLIRVLASQTQKAVDLIDYSIIDQSADAVRQMIEQKVGEGKTHFIMDSANDDHLRTIAKAITKLPLITGGSGLGGAIAALTTQKISTDHKNRPLSPVKTVGKTIILSGSCSVMTNQQVDSYHALGTPTYSIDVSKAINDPDYADTIIEWVKKVTKESSQWAPLIYATAPADVLQKTQETYGIETASQAVEMLFSNLAKLLNEMGFTRFIIAGGETSGAVIQALNITGFEIGSSITPGVPWVKDLQGDRFFTLKSGNFGDSTFFKIAQE